MFSRIPFLVFTVVLVGVAVTNLLLLQHRTVDEMLPYRLVFSAWGILTLMRIVLEPVPNAQDASERTTRVRVGEVIYWLAAAVAVTMALVMVDQTIFVGALTPPDIIRLCIPALVFAVGRAARYLLSER